MKMLKELVCLTVIIVVGIAIVKVLNVDDASTVTDRTEGKSVTESVTVSENISDTATFIRAKDGDTYVVKLDSNKEEITVRLIGVDTPESVAPEEYYKENTEEGKLISDIVKDKIKEGDRLSVEYDVQTEDKYGRTLAYLYFDNGEMVQEWLLKNGYAQIMTIQPNSKYADHFLTLQQEAIDNNVGLWKDLTFGNYIMND